MYIIGKFLIFLIIGGVVVSFVSIAWPKVTNQNEPDFLQKIKNTVIQTPLGKQTSQVLGVSDEVKIQPVDLQASLNLFKNWAIGQVENRTDEIVSKQIILQINGRFERLDDNQKMILREAICKPSSASGNQIIPAK